MNMEFDHWSLLSFFFFLSAIFFFCKGTGRGRAGCSIFILVSILTIIFSLLVGSYFVANWFTGIGFDDSILYHLEFGVEGAGFADFYLLIFVFIVLQLIFATSIVVYLRTFLHKYKCYKNSIPQIIKGAILVCCSFIVHPAASNLLWYLFNHQYSDDFIEYYIQPQVNTSVEKTKNIIYVYLESLEYNYMDESLFPGLTPELHKIEKASVSFTNIGQTVGASWTMAGMVASQCGLPLLTTFANDHFSMSRFMPNALCLGDILKSKGYHLEYFGGADTAFAGKGLFYKSHGFSVVKGKNEFINEVTDDKYVNNWGISDDKLYDLLLAKIKILNEQSNPWGMFSINIGTHQPDGYLAHSCQNFKYADGKDKLLNAVHCTDMLIGKLYQSLKKAGVLENTAIVFSSDHLAPVMVQPYETLKKKERHNIFMISGAGIKPSKNARVGTTLDISSTLLGFLNYGSHPIAFGRDLNGSLPTLPERFLSSEVIDLKIQAWRKIIDTKFWGYPSLGQALAIDQSTHQVSFGGQSYTFPLLIRYAESGKVEDIYFRYDDLVAYGDNILLPAFHLVNSFSNSQTFLWIDRCKELSTLAPSLVKYGNAYCYYNGSLAIAYSSGLVSDESKTIDVSKNEEVSYSKKLADTRRKELNNRNIINWDSFEWSTPETLSLPRTGVIAVGKDSLLQNSNIIGDDFSVPGLNFSRVFYKVDLNKGVTFYTDNIPKSSLNAASQEKSSIMKHIDEREWTFLFYILAGNVDEESRGYAEHLPGHLSAPLVQRLKPGESYIAIWDKDASMVYEDHGPADQAIGVKLIFNKGQ
ncbi:sulfatase-like hydrolase/transferase [Kluyvera sichuanensis]|uniref:sulfatase-like hydrolase/transferase n=1 Tax=Kluyvera sichuanensis TaxID=2725494 RepID=UPI0039F665F7